MKNGKTCDDFDSRCWEEHKMDGDNWSLYDTLEENTIYKLYICISETTNSEKDIMEGNNIVYLSENGWERGVIKTERKITRRKKYPAK